jgi:transposase
LKLSRYTAEFWAIPVKLLGFCANILGVKRSGGQKSIENQFLAVIRRLEARIAEQDRFIAEKDAVIAALQVRVGELEGALAKARKNSSTSSKPPSSDIVKANRKRSGPGEKKRRIGGQPGHPKHDRPAFSAEEIDEVHEHRLDSCPDCGGSLSPAGTEAPRTIQQIEIEPKPVRVDEHRGLAFWCANCERLHFAPLPPEVEKGGLVGPRLTTIIAYLKGACHASFSTIRKYLRDVLGVRISRGQLSRIIQKVSAALETAYMELLEKLPAQSKLNVDETGHKENGERFWTWCFRAEAFALFKISGSRGSDVLFEEAFTDAPYPGDDRITTVHLSVCGIPCLECAEVAAAFAGKDWRDYLERPYELLGYFPPREPVTAIGRDFMPLMTTEAFRYFLPVLLAAMIIDPEQADVLLDGMPSEFDPGSQADDVLGDLVQWRWCHDRARRLLESMSDRERQAVALALRYVQGTNPEADTDRIYPTVNDAIENLLAGAPVAWTRHRV